MLHDLRYAIRLLLKSPGFAGVAVVTLALGIGATTAMFTVVDSTLRRPLRYDDPDHLLLLWEKSPQGNFNVVSGQDFLAWRERDRSFEQMAALWWYGFDLRGNPPVHVSGARVSANFFELLRVRPELGRTFTAREDQPGQAPVAVLSDRLWRNRFAADRAILGRQITLTGVQYTVIGVLPPEFAFLDSDVDVWAPLVFNSNFNRDFRYLAVIGRLRRDVTRAQAQAGMDALAGGLAKEFPESNNGWGIGVQPIRDNLLGANVRAMVLILLGAGGFVLLIGCANIANLLLARGTARRAEFAVRIALGARRRQVVRQLLLENLPLALLGGAAGLLLASWAVDFFRTLDLMSAPGAPPIAITGAVLSVTLVLSIATTLLFGLVPALQVSKVNPYDTVKASAGASASVRHGRMRDALVVGELALSLALLVGAGLLLHNFIRLQQVRPGFDPHNVLTLPMVLPARRVPTEQVPAFYTRALENIRALPGVEGADLVSRLPLTGFESGRRFQVAGRDPKSPDAGADTNLQIITPGYFRTMRIPPVRGRQFTAEDSRDSVPVVIINQTLAAQFFPSEDPIGQHLLLPALVSGSSDFGAPELREIVGVCSSVKVSGLDSVSVREAYVPLAQSPWNSEYLVVRSASDPTALTTAIRQTIGELDPDQTLGAAQTMDGLLHSSLAGLRFNMSILGVFAAMALLLASLGVYGVVSYALVQRTHEIGIRMALGAHGRDVLAVVLRHSVRLVALGLAIGLAFSYALIQAIAAAVAGIRIRDPLTVAIVTVMVAGVASLACYLPARRATRVDPMVALRE